MKITQENKVKIILFASFGILLLLLIFLFTKGCSKEKEKEEDIVVLRNTDESEISLEDLLGEDYDPKEIHEDRETRTTFETITPEEEQNQQEIEALQKQLREEIPYMDYSDLVPKEQPIHQRGRQNTYNPPQPIRNENRKETTTKETPLVIEPIDPLQMEEEVVEQDIVEQKKKSRFYSTEKKQGHQYLFVSGTQKVTSGNTLKMVLSNPVEIQGVIIPKGTPVYGIVAIANSRLMIQIEAINYKNRTYPFRRSVVDADGIKGIYIADAETKKEQVKDEAVRQSSRVGNVVGEVMQTATQLLKSTNDNKILVKDQYKLIIK